jgi:hypothetical protein
MCGWVGKKGMFGAGQGPEYGLKNRAVDPEHGTSTGWGSHPCTKGYYAKYGGLIFFLSLQFFYHTCTECCKLPGPKHICVSCLQVRSKFYNVAEIWNLRSLLGPTVWLWTITLVKKSFWEFLQWILVYWQTTKNEDFKILKRIINLSSKLILLDLMRVTIVKSEKNVMLKIVRDLHEPLKPDTCIRKTERNFNVTRYII